MSKANLSENRLPSLSSLKSVHVIGVCGTLMGAFAAYLKRCGIRVTGSDQNVYPPMSDVLREAGVELLQGFRAENLQSLGYQPDLVVVGNVIRSDNPEARAAIDGGHVYSSLPAAMEKLFLTQTRNLVAAGTHGKTTTSSLLAHTLVQCGKDPSYFIGGVSHDLPFSFQISSLDAGQPFVLEGDEYDTAFWDKVPKFNHYLPDDVILTSIEYDHADIYPNVAAVVRAFEGLVSRVRAGGRMIACLDYPFVKEVTSRSHVPVITYGRAPKSGARYIPGKVRVEGGLTRFEVMDSEKSVGEITLQMPGMHNVMNALAVWIECRELGLDPTKVSQALASFQGVKRRQEVRGEVGGVIVMDDFAHHPTAVRETLQALRLKYPHRRLVTVFEPRSATSRRKVFQQEYRVAFQESDVIFISKPYDQTRISSDDQFSSETLVDDLNQIGKKAFVMSSVEEGVVEVAKQAQSGDLIAVLSNGGFGGFISKLLQALPG
jgi:UDP-N-acetylmuramate: L-alanyl-gamma-D-glutamyl-meso-diaminopimelate ligase